jgi:CubicO group peptidase (beta-lactamase class C family)
VPLAAFAQAELFKPMGIEGAQWPTGQDGVPNGASELRLTAPELLRIGQMVRSDGHWQGRQVVSRRFREGCHHTQKLTRAQPARGPKETVGLRLPLVAVFHAGRQPERVLCGRLWRPVHLRCAPRWDLVVVALTDQVSREVAGRTAGV